MWKGLVKTLDFFPSKRGRLLTCYIYLKTKKPHANQTKNNSNKILVWWKMRHQSTIRNGCGSLQVIAQTYIPGQYICLDIIISASSIFPPLSFLSPKPSSVAWAWVHVLSSKLWSLHFELSPILKCLPWIFQGLGIITLRWLVIQIILALHIPTEQRAGTRGWILSEFPTFPPLGYQVACQTLEPLLALPYK